MSNKKLLSPFVTVNYIVSIVERIAANAGIILNNVYVDKNMIYFIGVKSEVWQKDLFNNFSNEKFVAKLYDLAFSREPDEGSNIWVQKLAMGADKESVALRVFSSNERVRIITRGIIIH